ncbi:uncharacterized protein LOC105155498 isoform X2 [Sesamum indicum]|uniref:Uncharacterized protein LOC105155498 isoform X2 n=1 Tax=Sesamum indicum TaxID=4182 RepID=A0A6I9SIR9_SESIN|nr:uncharacterized protein LOC105155498 isoform X2 [Sesamum indicum]
MTPWPSQTFSRCWCGCTHTTPTTKAFIRVADHDCRSRHNGVTCTRGELFTTAPPPGYGMHHNQHHQHLNDIISASGMSRGQCSRSSTRRRVSSYGSGSQTPEISWPDHCGWPKISCASYWSIVRPQIFNHSRRKIRRKGQPIETQLLPSTVGGRPPLGRTIVKWRQPSNRWRCSRSVIKRRKTAYGVVRGQRMSRCS